MYKKTFHGGVHPYDGKEFARDIPFQTWLPKGDLVFHLNQHIGKPAKPLVQKGDSVLAGQIIAEADGFVSANIISSVSGTVKAIEKRENVLGTTDLSIVVVNDGQYTLAEGVGTEEDPTTLTTQEILAKVKAAGIVGLGGAGFPTHVKLAPKNPAAIKYVIANGAECEPYITCDDQLMRNYADEIVGGLKIMLQLFPNAEGVVLIEENKPEAIAAVQKVCANENKIHVHPVHVKYPQGGERAIMDVVAGKHIKLGMLPADVGCVVDNVATVRAIYRAVAKTEPLMERGFTVSGDGVNKPCNLIVKIGTSFEEMLEAAGGFKDGEEPEKILVASASIHGHTRAAAHTMAEKLRAKGAKVVEMDLTRTDVSYAVTEAFRCGRIVLACATYDGFLFPPMENLLTHLKTKNFQGRTVGLMENGTWAPMAAKLMRAELDGMKNITVCDAVVTIRSAANAAAEAQMDVLADELLAK